ELPHVVRDITARDALADRAPEPAHGGRRPGDADQERCVAARTEPADGLAADNRERIQRKSARMEIVRGCERRGDVDVRDERYGALRDRGELERQLDDRGEGP